MCELRRALERAEARHLEMGEGLHSENILQMFREQDRASYHPHPEKVWRTLTKRKRRK